MTTLGIIGGTGINRLAHATTRVEVTTPYGAPSAAPQRGRVGVRDVVFLARHGQPHTIAPHLVNYRANIWALRELGVDAIVATNAVGAIDPRMLPGELVVPDQIVDYSWGRAHTYYDGDTARAAPARLDVLHHVEFASPYDAELRGRLVRAAAPDPIHDGGCYGCTQGPRLESAAEIDRLERDGCAVVGMTGMPEAALARELSIPYTSLCFVVNAAAGRGDGASTMAGMEEAMRIATTRVDALLLRFCERG